MDDDKSMKLIYDILVYTKLKISYLEIYWKKVNEFGAGFI